MHPRKQHWEVLEIQMHNACQTVLLGCLSRWGEVVGKEVCKLYWWKSRQGWAGWWRVSAMWMSRLIGKSMILEKLGNRCRSLSRDTPAISTKQIQGESHSLQVMRKISSSIVGLPFIKYLVVKQDTIRVFLDRSLRTNQGMGTRLWGKMA